MDFDEYRQVAELNQRIRRVLRVFRTVAAHMAVHSRSSDDYALHLSGRIAALGRVVLAPVFFDGIDLESLVRDELQAAHPVQFILAPGVCTSSGWRPA
jgi:two-component system CheB/CheR fusion protein